MKNLFLIHFSLDEFTSIYYHNIKIYNLDFLNVIDEYNFTKKNNHQENLISFNFDKKKISENFLKDIKNILNPLFSFVYLNQGNNYLALHEDVEEDLIKLILDTTLEHYVKFILKNFLFFYFLLE